MEVFRTQTRISPFILTLSPTSSPPTILHRNTHFKPYPNPPYPTNRNRNYFRVMAGLGPLTSRRNSLRKKLDHKDNPKQNLEPVDHVAETRDSEPNLTNSGSQEGSDEQMGTNENHSEENPESSKDSDTEFWGAGWRAIFTVYEDSDGNVEQVSVDEEEILRRSGVNPMHFKEEIQSEGFDEVKSKISHAKLLAKEMESGKKNVIPRNSSVARFVTPGRDSGLLSRIRSVSAIPPGFLPRVSRDGGVLVCGFLFLWAMKKVFRLGRNERELTRFEKEMLRRKMLSRMAKENLQKRDAKVVEEAYETPTKRPQLQEDEEEEESDDEQGQVEEDVTRSSLEMASVNMDVKIQNIRMMAKHVRKIETIQQSANEGDDESVPEMENETAAESNSVNRNPTAYTSGSNKELKEVRFTSMQYSTSEPEVAQGSIVDTQIDLQKSGVDDGGNSVRNINVEDENHIPDQRSLHILHKSESERVPGENSSHKPKNSSAEL